MLRFYDHLRRQSQQVKRFEELIDEALGSDDVDQAARRMRIQTRFLAAAFRDYERRARESGLAPSGTRVIHPCSNRSWKRRRKTSPSRKCRPTRHISVMKISQS